MEANKGIKEIGEMIDGLGLVAVAGKKIMADSKVNFADLPHAMELISQSGVVVEAVKGADQIPAEAKDLSVEECQLIVAKVLALAAKIKAA